MAYCFRPKAVSEVQDPWLLGACVPHLAWVRGLESTSKGRNGTYARHQSEIWKILRGTSGNQIPCGTRSGLRVSCLLPGTGELRKSWGRHSKAPVSLKCGCWGRIPVYPGLGSIVWSSPLIVFAFLFAYTLKDGACQCSIIGPSTCTLVEFIHLPTVTTHRLFNPKSVYLDFLLRSHLYISIFVIIQFKMSNNLPVVSLTHEFFTNVFLSFQA